MLRSELAFIPNNLSSHSLHMTNFIEEEANEDNSEPKSSNSSNKKQEQDERSESKHSSIMQERSSNIRGEKMANQIQDQQSRFQVKNNVFDTPINRFNRPVGRYEYIPQGFSSEQQLLVQEITNQLNQIEHSEKPPQVTSIKIVKTQKAAPKENRKQPSIHNEIEEIKIINPLEEVDTDYSDISRDVKIYEHRYQSNLAYLSDQTKELLTYYEFMIQQQEQRQLRKKIMMLQINNHRAKISLRNASYSKRFNFISPIPKNNDKPLEFKPKFRVEQHLVDRMEELERSIKEQHAIWEEQEARLILLTKYYNIIKKKTIPNFQQSQADFRYDSKLERYTNRQKSIKNSTIAIDMPNTTNDFNITPASSLHTTNNIIRKSPTLKKGMNSPQKRASPKKLTTVEITEPYQKYNLLRYKTEISKEMMLEYEVYNLGRLKRIKDENRMIKKELEFIDEHIQHFDKSFAEELKKYQEKEKPKITYETFQSIEQDTPFTKSPWSRDYLGNNKGCNTINLYRPDSKEPKLLKSTSNSKPAINKSLSQSKYTIKRDQTINMSSSRRDITLSQNLLTQNDRKSEKSDTNVSFFRNKVNSPQKLKPKDVCIYTSRKQLVPIKERHQNLSKKSLSQRSISSRSKKLLRFNYQSQTQQSIGKRQIKSPKLRMTENRQKYETPSKKLIQSQYYVSPDQDTSNN